MPKNKKPSKKQQHNNRKEAAVCVSAFKPFSKARQCSQNYCEFFRDAPPVSSVELQRDSYMKGRKSQNERSVDRENKALGYTTAFIMAIQCRLNVSITGEFDPETRRAIMAIQKCSGMMDNGKITHRLLEALDLDPNKYDFDPKQVSMEELREKLGDTYTPGYSAYTPDAAIRLDDNYNLICPEDKKNTPAEQANSIKSKSQDTAEFHKYSLPFMKYQSIWQFPLESIENKKPMTTNFEKPKTTGFHDEKKKHHSLIPEPSVGVDLYLPSLEKLADNTMTEITGELQKFQEKGDLSQEFLKKALVTYILHALYTIEQADKEKTEALEWIHFKKNNPNYIFSPNPKWLNERERVSKWLVGLSKLFHDPAFSALALQGTHYAGLQSILSDAESGYPYKVNSMAVAVQSGEGGKKFAKSGNMHDVYQKGLVCNEYAYVAGMISGQIKDEDGRIEDVFPKSIHQDHWKMGKNLFSLCKEDSKDHDEEYEHQKENDNPSESCRFSINFSDIEQGDAIVSLKKGGEPKNSNSLEYDGIQKYDDYHGTHIDIVVAVAERIKTSHRRGKDEPKNESPKKAILLAGARGTTMPSGIHIDSGKMKWYFEDDKKFQSPFIIIKSKRLKSSVPLGDLFIDEFTYKAEYRDVSYNLDIRRAHPIEKALFINTPLLHLPEDHQKSLVDVKTGNEYPSFTRSDLSEYMKNIPKDKRQYFYALPEDEALLKQFCTIFASVPLANTEIRSFVLEYMRRYKTINTAKAKTIKNIHQVEKELKNYFVKHEQTQLKQLLNTLIDSEKIALLNSLIIYRGLSIYNRWSIEGLVKEFSFDWSNVSIGPIKQSEQNQEYPSNKLTKHTPIWR